MNLYGFVGNDSIWHIDVLGLDGEAACCSTAALAEWEALKAALAAIGDNLAASASAASAEASALGSKAVIGAGGAVVAVLVATAGTAGGSAELEWEAQRAAMIRAEQESYRIAEEIITNESRGHSNLPNSPGDARQELIRLREQLNNLGPCPGGPEKNGWRRAVNAIKNRIKALEKFVEKRRNTQR